jgi:hypothetical protein
LTLQGGGAAERLQLEARARLERALAVYPVAAVRLLRQFGVALPGERPPGLGDEV